MTHRTEALESLIQQADSNDPQERSFALQGLYTWVIEQPRSHSLVLPVLREILAAGDGSWAMVSSARGIDHIVGGEEARQAWLKVLTDPDPQVVILAASYVSDRSFAPVLLDLLASRPEIIVRNAAITALGRLQCGEALPVLIDALASEETRWDAIYALTNLGDPRAIPYLKPVLDDQSDLRGVDDRGCQIDVRDITGYAIRRLEHLAKTRPPEPPGIGLSRALKLPPLPETALPAPRLAGGVGPSALFSPPPLPATPLPPLPPSSPRTTARRYNLLAYLPLIAALVEIPWLFIVSGAMRGHTGVSTMAENKARIHQQDVLAVIPVGLGLLIGLTLLLRGTARLLPERICIYLGGILCVAFLWALGKEFFN